MISRICSFFLCSLWLVLHSSFSVLAQEDVKRIDMKEINRIKKEGRLTGKERFINFSSSRNTLPVSSSVAAAASTSCNCWLPRDASWQICQFDASGGNGGPGTSPDFRNDDWSTDSIVLPFNFCFYGSPVSALYINNNGNVSIGAPYSTFNANAFPDPSFVMIAPFWGDVDTRALGSGLVYYKLTNTYLAVQWDHVGYFDSYDDKLNTFQLILSDGIDSILPPGQNVSFCYQDMQWTTGDASGGNNGFGGIPSTVGVNRGDSTDYIQIGRYDTAGTAYDGPYGSADGISSLDNQSFYLNVCFNVNNVPPIVNALQICDTLLVCEGDTLFITANYLSPEQGQTTVATLNTNGVTGVSVASSSSGNSANIVVRVIGQVSNAGLNNISISGTDNGVPAQTTFTPIYFRVVTNAVAGFTFSPASPVLVGTLVSFTNTSTSSTNYLWDFGDASGTSTAVNPVHAYAAAGLYTVTLTAFNANGCSDVYQLQIQVNTCGVAGIVAGNVCEGVPLQISYAGNAGSLAAFNWNFAGGTIVSGSGRGPYMIQWNTPGNYNVALTVNDTGGCTAVAVPATVVVSANPAAAITSLPAVCEGQLDTVRFSGTILPGTTFSWNFTNAVVHSGSGPGPYVIHWNNAGVDTIHLIVSENGCSGTTSFPVLVNPTPVSTFTIPPSGCSNIPFSITYTGSSPASATYSWNFDGATVLSGSGQGPYSVSWNTAASHQVSLMVSQSGCVSPVTSNSLIVSGFPVADAGVDTTVCSGTNLQIGSPSQPGLTYLWVPSTGLSTPGSAGTVVATGNSSTSPQIRTYIVTVTNSTGCEDKDTVSVRINPTPVVSFTSPRPQCYNGNSFEFIAGGNHVNGVQYDWNFGNNASPDFSNLANVPSVSYSTAGTHQVTLNASANNCPAVAASNSVVVYTSPFANFQPDVYEGCVPLEVQFNNLSSGPGNFYSWNFSDAPVSGDVRPVHVFTRPGKYTVALIATTVDGCVTDTFFTDLINVHPLPLAAFEPSPDIAPVWESLINFDNYSVGAVQYRWEFGDNSSSDLRFPSHIYKDTGTYEVTLYVTSPFGCLDTIKGLVRIEFEYTFYVPNAFTPNSDGVNDTFRGFGTYIKTYELNVLNRWGKVIYSTADYNKPWDGKVDDVVQNGVYVYKIRVTDMKDKVHEYIGHVTLVR